MEINEHHKNSVALCRSLINVRGYLRKKLLISKIDEAIANVFDPETHSNSKRYIARIAEVREMGLSMRRLKMDTTKIKFLLDKVFDDEADATYTNYIAQWNDLYDLGKQMYTLGIATKSIEDRMRIIFEPTHLPSEEAEKRTSAQNITDQDCESVCAVSKDNYLPITCSNPPDSRLTPIHQTTPNASSAGSPPFSAGKRSAIDSASSILVSKYGFELKNAPINRPEKKRKLGDLSKEVEHVGKSFEAQIQSISTGGVRIKTEDFQRHLSLRFDPATQYLSCYCGEESLSAIFPCLSFNLMHVIKVIRPVRQKRTEMRVRFQTLSPQDIKGICDIIVPTREECKVLLTRVKEIVNFEEMTMDSDSLMTIFKSKIDEEKDAKDSYGGLIKETQTMQLSFEQPGVVTAQGDLARLLAMIAKGSEGLERDGTSSVKPDLALSVTLTEYKQKGSS